MKSRFRAAYLVVFGLLCLVAIYALKGDPPAQEPVSIASLASTAKGWTPLDAPAVVPEDQGRIERFRPVTMEVQPAMEVRSLFEPNKHLKLGETANLKFAALDRASGLPESLVNLSASVFHGNDPVVHVPVVEVDNGVYEVPFTPHGPGLFNVVLSEGGVPVGSQKVGVVGVAGAPNHSVDDFDPLTIANPGEGRARSGGRGRRR